mmetsp:Transcript_20775/g.67250  ORF Transcript_20775/g.67250 Transcript_20775/m.67250 type:complete len:221 (-) Transcript_20775:356-1018(-)
MQGGGARSRRGQHNRGTQNGAAHVGRGVDAMRTEQKGRCQGEEDDADYCGRHAGNRHGEHGEGLERRLWVVFDLRVEHEVGRSADERAHAAQHGGERERHQERVDGQAVAGGPALADGEKHGHNGSVVQEGRRDGHRDAQPQDAHHGRLWRAKHRKQKHLNRPRLLQRPRNHKQDADHQHRRRGDAAPGLLVSDDARQQQQRRRAQQHDVRRALVDHEQE